MRLLTHCSTCVGIVLAALLIRVACESVIVIFNMGKSLSVMEGRLGR